MSPRFAIAVLGPLTVALLAPADSHALLASQAQLEPFRIAAPSRAHGSTLARVLTPTFARRRVASAKGAWRVDAATAWSRQANVLLVLGAATHAGREWIKVLLPKRPNGSIGWIARDRVELSSNGYWIDVRKRARQVTI
jgi:hypothetical protein